MRTKFFDQFRNVNNWLNDKPQHIEGTRYLNIFLGCYMIYRAISEIHYSHFLYHASGIGSSTINPIFSTIFMDSFFESSWNITVAHIFMFLIGFGLVNNVKTRWCYLGIFLFYQILNFRMVYLGDGGDNLMSLLCYFGLLLMTPGDKYKQGSLKVFLHNIGVVLIVSQVLQIYFIAGIMKAAGDTWQQGTAMYLVSQLDWFGHPLGHELFKNASATVLVSYITIIYQVTFPVAFFSRFKMLYVAMGLAFHIGIAVSMGLITFSLVMCGVEAFLLNEKEYAWLRQKLQLIKTWKWKQSPVHVLTHQAN